MAKCQPGNEQGIRNCTQKGALPEPFPSGRAPPGAARDQSTGTANRHWKPRPGFAKRLAPASMHP